MDNNQNNDKFVMDTSYMNNNEPVMVNQNTVEQPVMNPAPAVQEQPVMNPTPVVEPTPVVTTQPEPVVVPQQPTVQTIQEPTAIPNVNNDDPNTMVNEKLKKVEINYTPPSKAKVVLLVLFFIALLGFIIFLSNISSLVNKFRSGDIEEKEEVINTGRLKCSLNTTTTNLDKDYDLTFRFTDKKLEKTEFIITTKGDVTLDEETLDKLATTCKQLKENVKNLKGVTIQCNYTDGKLEEIQTYDLENIDSEQLNSAFIEAGGNNPKYQYGQDIDRIEKDMNASGYTCKREK